MPKNSTPRVALVYDYDGTLIKGNMQDYGLIQDLTRQSDGKTTATDLFWKKFKPYLKANDKEPYALADDKYDDKVLAYLDCLLHRRELIHTEQSFQLTKEKLTSYGKNID